MKILDKYIIRTILIHTVVVMIILSAVHFIFTLLAELPDAGHGNYNMIEIFIYTIMRLPADIYVISPIIILIGMILGLGNLSENQELTVIKGSGFSVYRISYQVLKAGIFLIIPILLFSELFAFHWQGKAENYRAWHLSSSLEKKHFDLWLKVLTGFLHLKKQTNNELLDSAMFIQVSDNRIAQITRSTDVSYDKKHLYLKNATHTQINYKENMRDKKNNHDKKIIPTPKSTLLTINEPNYQIPLSLDKNILINFDTKPSNMNLRQLWRHLMFMSSSATIDDTYSIEFYKRLAQPFLLVAMIFLAVIFIFARLKDLSLGKKVFMGLVFSLIFSLIIRLSTEIALTFGYNIPISVFLPIILLLVTTIILLYYIAKA